MSGVKDLLLLAQLAAKGRLKRDVLLGTAEEPALSAAKSINKNILFDDVYGNGHTLASRSIKNSWSPQYTVNNVEKVLGPGAWIGPNYPGRQGEQSFVYPQPGQSVAAPFSATTNRQMFMHTIMEEENARIINNLYQTLRNPNLPAAERANYQDLLDKYLKGPLPSLILGSGGLLGMLAAGHGEAQAADAAGNPLAAAPIHVPGPPAPGESTRRIFAQAAAERAERERNAAYGIIAAPSPDQESRSRAVPPPEGLRDVLGMSLPEWAFNFAAGGGTLPMKAAAAAATPLLNRGFDAAGRELGRAASGFLSYQNARARNMRQQALEYLNTPPEERGFVE